MLLGLFLNRHLDTLVVYSYVTVWIIIVSLPTPVSVFTQVPNWGSFLASYIKFSKDQHGVRVTRKSKLCSGRAATWHDGGVPEWWLAPYYVLPFLFVNLVKSHIVTKGELLHEWLWSDIVNMWYTTWNAAKHVYLDLRNKMNCPLLIWYGIGCRWDLLCIWSEFEMHFQDPLMFTGEAVDAGEGLRRMSRWRPNGVPNKSRQRWVLLTKKIQDIIEKLYRISWKFETG